MALRYGISAARWGSAGAPVTIRGLYKTGEAIIKGSVLTLDANGELTLNTSDANNPANGTIAGIAYEAAGSAPGFSVGQTDQNGTSVFTGREQSISYGQANLITVWAAQISADGLTETVPTQTLISEQYKLSKAANGIWYVDSADATPANVVIVDINDDPTYNLVYFLFTEVAIQLQ